MQKVHNFLTYFYFHEIKQYFSHVIDAGESDVSKRKKRKIYNGNSDKSSSEDKDEKCDSDNDDDDDDSDDPVTCFRRGQDLPDDLDLGDNSQDSVDDLEADDLEDDREWNAMGAALEREFLSE